MSDKLNKKEIIDLLPHREPMLLIDELKNIKKLFSATAVVKVRKEKNMKGKNKIILFFFGKKIKECQR